MGAESELNGQSFREAILRHDVASITQQLVESQFVLIHLAEEAESDDVLGALTATSGGRDYLVAFSSQKHASRFVESRSDLFEEESEVSGFWVDGRTLLDYLDDELGILLNPDGEGHRQIEVDLVREILDELGLEG
ncbi:SseB family protein [Aporhodopirellula aestuarii]|uniref:SseB family protein n=1 Tax=Aporhodopirellula aestuarii TaxID=2950107 RepID=A0ABT0U8G7_9BACT|nr:SseB family protein [Aporhodopirellula aestuarii]MCM2373071.1 SseB family protein [Aporhodopirellula aestuarii]